jgi:hypothetical protein
MQRWLLCIAGLCFLTAPLFAADPPNGKTKGRVTKNSEAATGPRDYSSKNFVLHTDLTAEEAKELLVRLETMLLQVGKYWADRTTRSSKCSS